MEPTKSADVRHPSPGLCGKSGFFSTGGGGSAAIEGGAGEIILSLVLGAFCGLVLGFMIAHVLRYCSILVGRNIGGYSWTIYGALVGAALFAIFTAATDED